VQAREIAEYNCHALGFGSYTTEEKVKIIAGAVASLVIVGWLVVLAIVVLSAR
jgi:hypothetical protein